MNRLWFVHIATNHANTVFYTGITNDPNRRIYEHKTNKDVSFSGRYHLYKILYLEEFSTPQEAITAEKKIKGWTRQKKLHLIKQLNPDLNNLVSLR